MKTFITFFVAAICFLGSTILLSQNRNHTSSQKDYFKNINIPTGGIDTINYITFPPELYTAAAGGYVSGTNGYGDLGKYQRFDFDQSVISLLGLVAFFGEKEVVGTADSIDFVVKEIGAGGAPGATIISERVTTDELDTTDFITSINFDHTVNFPGQVFIGFEWTIATDDTFGLLSDVDGGGDGENRAWEKWSDGQYFSYTDEDSWELDIDLYIGAIALTSTTGIEVITPSGFSLSQNYPNPFNPDTKITFTLPTDSKVKLKIYNLLGEEVAIVVNKEFSAGSHIVNFNASNLNSGVYFYKLESMGIHHYVEGTDGIINTAVKKMILMK